MFKYVMPAIALTVATATGAAALSLSLPLGEGANIATQSYQCGDAAMTVHYVNDGRNSLALVPVEGETVVFVNTVAASGAKYVSGSNSWWSNGDSVTFEDELVEGSAVECAIAE